MKNIDYLQLHDTITASESIDSEALLIFFITALTLTRAPPGFSLDSYIGSRYNRDTIYRYPIDRAEEGNALQEHLALTEATYYILLSLYEPRHGYGIMQQTERLSAGRLRLAAGTLYGALNSLCEKGWIVPLPMTEDGRRREYKLTETGFSVLKNELNRLRQLVENGEAVLREEAK